MRDIRSKKSKGLKKKQLKQPQALSKYDKILKLNKYCPQNSIINDTYIHIDEFSLILYRLLKRVMITQLSYGLTYSHYF